MFNSGYSDLAREQARHTISVFAGDNLVIVPSGSCAAMVKVEYPHILEADPVWHERALDLSRRTFEFSDFLVNHLQVVDLGARYDGKVAYHYACHLRMLGQTTEVETLISHVKGAEYVPLNRQDQCCGFGGSFAVRYPQISGNMVEDKVRCLMATGARCVVSTDTGCMMNIGGRLHREGHQIELLHIAELLERQE